MRPPAVTAALLAATLAAPSAFAQAAGNVSVSGATLFSGFLTSPANASDAIDADGDGTVTNLESNPVTFDNLYRNQGGRGPLFNVQTRGIGSGNGLAELVNFGSVNAPANNPWSALAGGEDYVWRNGSGGLNAATAFTGPAVIDVAPLDVNTAWFITDTRGPGAFGNSPFAAGSTNPQAGYGNNGARSNAVRVGATGDLAGGQGNKLKSLTPSGGGTTLNTNTAAPDANTIFDTEIAFVPVGVVANFGAQVRGAGSGAGVGDVTKTELQHLFVSGRMNTGENLVAATRDSGSGTRNAAMNAIGVDPSWGTGDNVGQKNGGNSDTPNGLIGRDFVPTNKDGSSRMEGVVLNHRLAVGYTGLADGPNESSRALDDVAGNRYELLNIGNDTDAAWVAGNYVRARMTDTVADASGNNVVFNANPNTGYQIGGSETFATIGNPEAGDIYVRPEGGQLIASFTATGASDETVVRGTAPAGDPRMADPYAALWVRNITGSIANFISPTGDPEGTPGAFLAQSFSLVAAVEETPDPTNTGVFIQNPTENASLQTVGRLPVETTVGAYGTTGYGRTATRTSGAGVAYSDGVANGANYVTNAGGEVRYGQQMRISGSEVGGVANDQAVVDRNAVMGDFNGDGNRDAADAAAMARTYLQSGALAPPRRPTPRATPWPAARAPPTAMPCWRCSATSTATATSTSATCATGPTASSTAAARATPSTAPPTSARWTRPRPPATSSAPHWPRARPTPPATAVPTSPARASSPAGPPPSAPTAWSTPPTSTPSTPTSRASTATAAARSSGATSPRSPAPPA